MLGLSALDYDNTKAYSGQVSAHSTTSTRQPTTVLYSTTIMSTKAEKKALKRKNQALKKKDPAAILSDEDYKAVHAKQARREPDAQVAALLERAAKLE